MCEMLFSFMETAINLFNGIKPNESVNNSMSSISYILNKRSRCRKWKSLPVVYRYCNMKHDGKRVFKRFITILQKANKKNIALL